jgi:NADH-quinone oxidoreductase subunit N
MQLTIQEQLTDILKSVEYFSPEIVLSLTFLAAIFAHLFSKKKNEYMTEFVVISGLLIATYFTLEQLKISNLLAPSSEPRATRLIYSSELEARSLKLFGGMLLLNSKAIIFKLIFLLSSFLFFIFSSYYHQIKNTSKGKAEFFILIPVFVLGMNLMAMASHLLMMYLALETVSILSYIFVGYKSTEKKSSESAIKYALFGAISSAVMLYGISLLYGFAGTLELHDGNFLANLSKAPEFASSLAILMVMAGFIYKISAVPFHFYTPDVYEGSPVPVVAFLSVAPKAAGFAVLINFIGIFVFPFENYHLVWPKFNWENNLIALSIITMTVGNFSALAQTNLKRLLAYSSIAHTGFILMALAVFNDLSNVSLFYYLIVYMIMNFGAFIIIGLFEEKYNALNLNDYKGLAKSAPFISVCLVIFLASLTGLPPTGGFVGKFLLFSSVWESYTLSQNPWLLYLLIAGVINTVISLFFYLKIPLNMYFRKSDKDHAPLPWSVLSFVVFVLTVAILLIGIFPSELTSLLSSLH